VTAVANSTIGYTLTSTSAGSQPVTYTLVATSGSVNRTCSPVSTGGCNAAGKW
jgi:hypothetical protein